MKSRSRVCNIGGTLYTQPLNETQEKKFRALATICDMFVIAFSSDNRPRFFSEHAGFYLLPRLPVPLLRYGMMGTVGLVLALWCVLRHDTRVIMAQSPYEGFIGAWAKVLARVFGKKVALIVEGHGDFEVAIFLQRRIPLPWLYRLVMRLTAGFAIRRADLLRSVSNTSTAQLKSWGPDKPIHQFPAWTDIEPFLEGESARDDRSNRIVYAGALIPRKGVHHLINAFANVAQDVSPVELLLIGREENKVYTGELRAQVGRMGLEDRVRFVGEVSQSSLAEHMRQAAVFVLPTYAEGLPRVVWEAMAAELPVVATSVSGIPELIEDGETGFLVQPGDEDALAERLQWVLKHPDEARGVGRRAREFSQRFYSTEVYLEGFSKLLNAAQSSIDGVSDHRAASPP